MSDHGSPGSLAAFERIERLHLNETWRSEVWRAKSSDGVLVALKLVRREADPEEQAFRQSRFEAEVGAGRALRHVHIRALLWHGSDPEPTPGYPDGCDWLAFKWIEGITLAELLRERRSAGRSGVSARDLRAICHAVANGLDVMHGATPPWVHRDVKPANVLLPGGDCQSAVLADLGIAWRDGSPRLTRVAGGSGSGTWMYMAPEQLVGTDELGPATDLYALALMLWECAMGAVPYATSLRRTDLEALRLEGAPLASLLVDGQPAPTLETVLLQALRPDAGERWPDVHTFWDRFHRAGEADGLWDSDVSHPPQTASLVVPSAAAAVSGTAPARAAIEDPGYGVPEVWLEQQAHLKSFVGRDDLLSWCRSWLRGESDESYLLLVGPPGQGKSALMARLAALEGASAATGPIVEGDGACLLHHIKSHGEPRRILQSLLWQAESRLGVLSEERVYRGSIEDLRGSLVGALTRLVDRAGAVSIVLDGLDELNSDAQDFRFLPPRLPAGVRWVLSSRQDADLVGKLRTSLGSLSTELVPPLSERDARQFIELNLGLPSEVLERVLDVAQLQEIAAGSPLVLRHAADRVRQEAQVLAVRGGHVRADLSGLPTSADAVFREVYATIAGRRGGHVEADVVRARTAVTHVIACAQSPLEIAQLRAVLRAGGHDVGRDALQAVLDGLSQYLQPLEGKYALFHKGMVDYVRRSVLDDDGVADVHSWFLAWLAEGRLSRGYYAEHVAEHHRDRFHSLSELGDREGSEAALRAWLREIVSVPYARSRIEAGHVYEFRSALETCISTCVAEDRVGTGRDVLRAIEEECALALEWHRFLEARAYVLAEAPGQFTQELRNAHGYERLAALAASLVSSHAMLIVRQPDSKPEEVSSPAQLSRLLRRSVSCPPISALWCDQNGGACATLHDEGHRLGVWAVSTGQGSHHQAPDVGYELLVADPSEDRFVLASRDRAARWGGQLSRLRPPRPELATQALDWQSDVGPLNCLAPVGPVLFAGLGLESAVRSEWSGGEVQRMEWASGSARTIARFARAVTHVVAVRDGAWVAACVAGEVSECSELVVLDGVSGAQLAGVKLDEGTSWLGGTPDGQLLVSTHDDCIRVWSVPGLRELGTMPIPASRARSMMFHSERPLALMVGASHVFVLDLRTLTVVRQEWWAETPGRATMLVCDGSLLIGNLGDPSDLGDEPEAVGVWALPDHFWGADDSDERTLSAVNPDRPEVGAFKNGRGRLVRPSDTCLLVYGGETSDAVSAFTAPDLGGERGVAVVDEDRIVLASAYHLDVLHVSQGVRERRLRLAADLLFRVEAHDGALRAFLLRKAHHDVDTPSRRQTHGDIEMAEVLARGIAVNALAAPPSVVTLPVPPWGDAADGQGFGMATLDLEAGAWLDFVELPGRDEWGDWFEMPGGKYIVFARDSGFGVVVVSAMSGERLLELDDDLFPVSALDAHRLVLVGHDGRVIVVDILDGTTRRCGLDVGDTAWLRSGFALALSPDGRLAVWNAFEAIVVSELQSGREVARFATRRWQGRLSFLDERTIAAEEYGGQRVVLVLEGLS